MSQVTSEERTKVLEALRVHKGVFEREGGGPGAVGALAGEIKMTSQRLTNILPQLENDGVELRREGPGPGVTVILLNEDPAISQLDLPANAASDSIDLPTNEEPAESEAATPQAEPAEVDRIGSLLEEAKAEVADAVSLHKGGASSLSAVTSAIQSLVAVQSHEAEEATERERTRIFKSLGSMSVAEVLKLIEREQ